MYYHTEGLRVKARVSAESPSSESSRGGSALLFPPCRGCWGPLALRGLWEHVFNLCLHLQPHGRLFSESGPSSNKDRSHWIRSTLMQLGGYPGGGVCVCVAELCPTLWDPMDCSQQAPLPLGFSWQEYWTGLPFPSPGDLPDPGIEPRSPALQAAALPSEPPGTCKWCQW